MAMDVMMMLEGEALTQVYTVFKDKNDREGGSGLSQTEFVSAVLKYLPRRYLHTLDKVDLVMQLSELFAQVCREEFLQEACRMAKCVLAWA